MKSLFERKKQKKHFRCAQCGSDENQYDCSIICIQCAQRNKLREAQMILGENIEGKLLTAIYNEETREIELKIED